MSTTTSSSLASPAARPAATPWQWVVRALFVAFLAYLPVLLTERAIFGVPLSNMQLLNLGLTQINLMLIAMLGALSLNYLTGCAGLISIGHAGFYAVGAMTAAWATPTAIGRLAPSDNSAKPAQAVPGAQRRRPGRRRSRIPPFILDTVGKLEALDARSEFGTEAAGERVLVRDDESRSL